MVRPSHAIFAVSGVFAAMAFDSRDALTAWACIAFVCLGVWAAIHEGGA